MTKRLGAKGTCDLLNVGSSSPLLPRRVTNSGAGGLMPTNGFCGDSMLGDGIAAQVAS